MRSRIFIFVFVAVLGDVVQDQTRRDPDRELHLAVRSGLLYSPEGPRPQSNEPLVQTILRISHIETQSPHYIGTWILTVVSFRFQGTLTPANPKATRKEVETSSSAC